MQQESKEPGPSHALVSKLGFLAPAGNSVIDGDAPKDERGGREESLRLAVDRQWCRLQWKQTYTDMWLGVMFPTMIKADNPGMLSVRLVGLVRIAVSISGLFSEELAVTISDHRLCTSTV